MIQLILNKDEKNHRQLLAFLIELTITSKAALM